LGGVVERLFGLGCVDGLAGGGRDRTIGSVSNGAPHPEQTYPVEANACLDIGSPACVGSIVRDLATISSPQCGHFSLGFLGLLALTWAFVMAPPEGE